MRKFGGFQPGDRMLGGTQINLEDMYMAWGLNLIFHVKHSQKQKDSHGDFRDFQIDRPFWGFNCFNCKFEAYPSDGQI